MAAIRWDNINAPSNGEALRGFEFASRGISSGFDKLGQVLADREVANQGVIDRGRESDKQGFLDMLDGAKTPEALQAMQLSGALDQRLQALDPRSRAAVRGAGDARLLSLRQQYSAGNAFANEQLTEEQKPIVAEVDSLRSQGKHAQADQLAINANLPNRGALIEANRKAVLGQASDVNALAEQQLKTSLRGQNDSNARAQAVETGAALGDVVEGRAVDAHVKNFVGAHQDTVIRNRTALTKFADTMGPSFMPRNKDGTIALNQMQPADRAKMNKLAMEQGFPSLDTLDSGDAAAQTKLIEELKVKGYNPSQIARVAQALPYSLSTTPSASIGNDKVNEERQVAERSVLQEAVERQYGVKAEPGNVGEILKGGSAAIDAAVQPGPRSEIYKERLAIFLQKGGIKPVGKDGKPDPESGRILPNPDQIQMIVTGIEKKWHNTQFSWAGIGKSGMQEEIDNALENWAKSPEALAGAAKLSRLDLTKQLQTIRKAEEQAAPLPAALGGPKKK